MVAQTLVPLATGQFHPKYFSAWHSPRGFLEFALTIHIDPSSLKTQNTACSKVNSTVIEVISHGKLTGIRKCQILGQPGELTKALQFLIAQTCPTYDAVSTVDMNQSTGDLSPKGYLLCNAVALVMYCLSPGSQSFLTSFGTAIPSASSSGRTSRQNWSGDGTHPVHP